MNEQENPNNTMNGNQNNDGKSLFDTNVANTYNNYAQNLEHLEPSKTEPEQSSEDSPFFTPVSIQPDFQENPVLPDMAQSNPEVENNSETMESNGQDMPIQEEIHESEVSPTVVVPENEKVESQSGVEVIETASKTKAGNAVLIIFLILLILFVFNIDFVIKMIDQYKVSKNPGSAANKTTNNLKDGYILIDDNTSSIKLKDIKFYNFRKSIGKGVTFSYEALANYSDATSLEIYLEVYNSERELLYKELFDPKQKIEKDTVRSYIMDVDDIIYNNAFYALVKIYSESEKKVVASLTCTLDDGKYTYKNEYSFLGNGLSEYVVTKTSKKANDSGLQKEYDDLKKSVSNATLEKNTLKYKVDLNKENGEYVEIYEKDVTLKFVKEKETLKEWKCE